MIFDVGTFVKKAREHRWEKLIQFSHLNSPPIQWHSINERPFSQQRRQFYLCIPEVLQSYFRKMYTTAVLSDLQAPLISVAVNSLVQSGPKY